MWYYYERRVRYNPNHIKEIKIMWNGNIELKSSDVEETKPLGVNTEDYSDDKKFNALRGLP